VQVVSVLAIMIQFLYSNELVKNRLDLTWNVTLSSSVEYVLRTQ
jgi:hypothetical protein